MPARHIEWPEAQHEQATLFVNSSLPALQNIHLVAGAYLDTVPLIENAPKPDLSSAGELPEVELSIEDVARGWVSANRGWGDQWP